MSSKYAEFFADFREYIDATTKDIALLHTEMGLGPMEIVMQQYPKMAEQYEWSNDKYEIGNNYIQEIGNTHVGPIKYVVDSLKDSGVYSRSTRSKIQKMQKTMLRKYGVTNAGQLGDSRRLLSDRNRATVTKVETVEYISYYKAVERLTNKVRRKWKISNRFSKDYYTKLPFLKELSESDQMQGDLYPTLDHKLSVRYCFMRNLSPEACAAEENLCWTFRYLNSRKGELTEQPFRQFVLPLYAELIQSTVDELIHKGYTRCE